MKHKKCPRWIASTRAECSTVNRARLVSWSYHLIEIALHLLSKRGLRFHRTLWILLWQVMLWFVQLSMFRVIPRYISCCSSKCSSCKLVTIVVYWFCAILRYGIYQPFIGTGFAWFYFYWTIVSTASVPKTLLDGRLNQLCSS